VTTDVQFTDAEFSFRTDGITFHVRTETAPDSFARVVVEELSGPPEPQMEGVDE
jgi:hypothetical protein